MLNHDSAIASAASRMTIAAAERPCVEMGSRRTHEEAAVAAARAAYIGGFACTSNLQAGRRHAISTAGTSAHAFTLVHDTERQAFQAQIDTLGKDTTMLVDTHDVGEAVRLGVELAGPELGAVRIDSGDLPALARQVRGQLDELGASDTRIVVTGDLEHAIARLATAPVDTYGVGAAVVTGGGAPTANLVYKLVARATSDARDAPFGPIEKKSAGKATRGGRKYPVRRYDPDGIATTEVIGIGAPLPRTRHADRPLLVPLVHRGEIVALDDTAEARDRHLAFRAELPPQAHRLSRGDPAIPTVYQSHRLHA